MTRGACEISWFSALCDDDYEFLGAVSYTHLDVYKRQPINSAIKVSGAP